MRLRTLQKEVFVDSNVFFYSIIMDRKYGESCARILRDIYKGNLRAYISPIILLEVANTLRKFGIRQFQIKIKAIISLPVSVIELDAKDVLDAINLASKINISPYDAIHVIAMRKVGIRTIISADRDFDKIKTIVRLDPINYNSGIV